MQKRSSPLLILIKVFSSLLIPIVLSTLYFQGKLRIYDNQVSDLIALHLSYNPPSITKDIVYVMLSQQDLNEASQEYKMGWPWKRQAIGKIVHFLQLSEAKVIGLNFFFTEKSVYNTKELSDDQMFCKSLKASDNIVLAFQFLHHEDEMSQTASQEGITDPDLLKAELLPFAVQSHQKSLKIRNYYKAELPIAEILSCASRLGAVNLEPDSDQIFRHLSPLFHHLDHYYPSFGLAVLSRLFNESHVSFKDNAIQFKDRSIPLNLRGALRLKFYGSNDIYKDYYFMDLMRVYDQLKAIYNKYKKLYPKKNISLKEVYRNVSVLQEMIQKVKAHDPLGFQGFSEELIQSHLPERFKGKIVLMGSIASGLINLTPTYYDPKEVGLHLHATFINNFLNNDFLTEIGEDLYQAILLVISTAFITYFTIRHKYSLSISITFITIIVILAASVLLYNEGNIVIDTFTPLLIGLFTFINTTIVKHFEAHIRLKEYAGEIKYQKEEYQKLIDSANDPILIIQKDKIVFANPKTKELFGYSEDEIRLLSLGDFIHFNGKEGDLQGYIGQIDDQILSPAETRVQSKDGSLIWVESNGVCIDWKGEAALLIILRDIQQRKLAEERLQSSKESLKITVQQLEVEKDLNNQLEREFSRLNVKIHNSLKNKLEAGRNLILNFMKRKDNPMDSLYSAEKLLSHCSLESKNILFIINYKECTLGKISSELRLQAEMNLVVQDIHYDLEKDRVHDDLKVSPEIAQGLLDIYSELLNNIIKHSRASSVEIIIKYEDQEIKLIVKDDGCGFQYNEQSKENSYGLEIIENLVHELRGKLTINSRISKGTEVCIQFPYTARPIDRPWID